MARQTARPPVPIEEPNLPVERLHAQQQISAQMEAYAQEHGQIRQMIGEFLGRRQMAKAITKLVTVAEVIDIQRMKESKIYRDYKAVIDGKLVTVAGWPEFCDVVLGRSRESVDLELKNLQVLGVEMFDAMRQIGLGPGTMRDYRSLPEDDRTALLEVAKTGEKESFLELAETLIAKHQRDKELLQAQVKSTETKLEKEKAIAQRQLDQKNQHAVKLEKRVAELQTQLEEKYESPPDWDARIGQLNQDVTVQAGMAVERFDKLSLTIQRIDELAGQCGEVAHRTMGLHFLAALQRLNEELQILNQKAEAAFGGLQDAAALEAADYRLSDLPTTDEMVDYIDAEE